MRCPRFDISISRAAFVTVRIGLSILRLTKYPVTREMASANKAMTRSQFPIDSMNLFSAVIVRKKCSV